MGWKEQGGDAADRGHKVHKVLEDWQKYATPPDLTTLYGRIAKPAIKHTPPPMSHGVAPEEEVHWTSPLGNDYLFLKDLEYSLAPTAYIWDYKTTSNLKYAHTTEELLNTDPQGIIYPAHRFIVSPAVLEVKSAWLYLTANAPHYCHPVYAVHERKHCLKQFTLLDNVASVMLEHRRQRTNPLAFKPNPSYCLAYNRQCPFTNRCNLTDLEKMIAMNEQSNGPNTANFLASIRRNAEGGPIPGAGAPAVVSAPTPVTQTPPAGFALANLGSAPVAPVAPVVAAPALPWAQPAAPAQLPWTQPAAAAAPALPWAQPAAVEPVQTDQARAAGPIEEALKVQVVSAEPAKRKRRTKAEIEAAKAAEPVTITTEGSPVPEEESAEEYDARTAVVANNSVTVAEVPVGDSLLVRIAIAMAGNPGYCTLDSAAFASKAASIAAAVQAEENDL